MNVNLPSQISASFLKDIFLIGLAVSLFVMMFQLIAPFATTLLLALLIVALFQPLYKSIEKRSNNFLALFLSTISVILVVIIPLFLTITIIGNELAAITTNASKFLNEAFFGDGGELLLVDGINSFLSGISPSLSINPAEFEQAILEIIRSAGNTLSAQAVGIFQNLGGLFIQIIVFLIAIVLIFRDYERIPSVMKTYIPLSDQLEEKMLMEFLETGKALIKGIFLVAGIHAAILTFIFWIFGAQSLGILAVILFISSLVPGGNQIIWIPSGVLIGVVTGWPAGILVLVLSFISMNFVDTFVRPFLTQGGSKLHPLLSLISLLGGIVIYGFPGLLYGPLIAVLFVTVLNAYNQRFKT